VRQCATADRVSASITHAYHARSVCGLGKTSLDGCLEPAVVIGLNAVKCAVTASSWPLEIVAGLSESNSDHSCSLPVALCPNKSHYRDYLTSGRWWWWWWLPNPPGKHHPSSNIQKHRDFHSSSSLNQYSISRPSLPKPSSLDRHRHLTVHRAPYGGIHSLSLLLNDHPSLPFLRLTFHVLPASLISTCLQTLTRTVLILRAIVLFIGRL
jgi:hypothetical protein